MALLVFIIFIPCFLTSLAGSLLAGYLLSRTRLNDVAGIFLSFASGLAFFTVVAILAFFVQPNLGHFILAAPLIIAGASFGSIAGAFPWFRKKPKHKQIGAPVTRTALSPQLIFGIIFLPYIFAWFALRKRLSPFVRNAILFWLIISLFSLTKSLLQFNASLKPESCINNPKVHAETSCLVQLAIAKNDPSICSKSSKPGACFIGTMFKLNGPNYSCDKYPRHPTLGDVYKVYCEVHSLRLTTEQEARCASILKGENPFEVLAGDCHRIAPDWRSSKSGDSILMTTLKRDNDLVQILPVSNITYEILDRHPDLSVQNVDGNTALHLVDNWTIFAHAIKQGRNVALSTRNQKGETALHSIFRKYVPTREWMISEAKISGSDMNIPDLEGNTPLHVLVNNIKSGLSNSDMSDIGRVTKLLVSLGANPDLKNGVGISARDLAKIRGIENLFQ